MRPFFRYYGGKFRAAPSYPPPMSNRIVEPFAGSAGYSLRHPDREVVLVERYHVLAEIWRWLISASEDEVRSIPLVDDVRDLPSWVMRGARWLIGFAMNAACAQPRVALAASALELRRRGRRFYGWSKSMRERVASQVGSIRHWEIIEGDYTLAPRSSATWFVDPPYQFGGGSHYTHGSGDLDYAALGRWCRDLPGQSIVCEGPGARWLPFEDHMVNMGGPRSRGSTEMIWSR